jgi:hypothetical protein
MEPTADDEPGEMEFDALTDDPDVLPSRMPLGSEWLRQPLAGIPLMWLAGNLPGPYAAGDSMGGGSIGSIGIPGYGYGADRLELEIRDAPPEFVLYPLIDGEPQSDGVPPTGPFTNPRPTDPHDPGNPDEPTNPGDPGDPEDPYYPILPPAEDPVVAPEPATLLLVGGGLATWVARRRRRQ